MENESNKPMSILERKFYKLLRYADVTQIDGNDRLFFNYVLSNSKKTDKKDKEGNYVYENNNINLSKIEDIVYIESLLYRLKTKKTEEEIQSQFYFAKKIKNDKGFFNKFCITKQYIDTKTNKEKRTVDCILPLIDLPILLNFLKEINYKTSSIYQKERQYKDSFYNNNRSEDPIPDNNQFIDTPCLDDEIPF